MELSEYFNCLLCDIFVPHYAAEVHAIECKRSEPLTHPFICGKLLSARINIISFSDQTKERSKKSNRRIKNESNVLYRLSMDEPVWMNRLRLPYKKSHIVFMNKFDLLHCGIETFTPCLLSAKEDYSPFCAIACKEVTSGNILLYDSGVDRLQLSPGVSFLLVQSLKLKLAKEAYVELFDIAFDENSLIEKFVDKYLKTNTTLESNIAYRLGQEISVQILDKIARVKIQEIETFDQPHSISQNASLFSTSENRLDVADLSAIINSFCIDSLSENSPIEKLVAEVSKLTIKENKSEDAERSFNTESSSKLRTSTPKRTDEHLNKSDKSLYNSQVSSKKYNKEKKSIKMERIIHRVMQPPYFTIDRSTSIIFHNKSSKGDLDVANSFHILPFHINEMYNSLRKQVTLKLAPEDMAGLFSWHGVLLSGLPGTGKTRLSHQLAKDMQLPLINLCLNDRLYSNLEEDEYVEKVFREALQKSPSIIFIDEIDAICPKLSNSQESSYSRLILKHLSRIKSNKIFILAATNRPELVSSKLRCPSILAREICIPLPDCSRRTDILTDFLSGRKHTITQEQLTHLGRSAHGFSTSDLESASHVANDFMLEAYAGSSKCEMYQLTYEHLLGGIETVVPPPLRLKHTAVSTVSWSDIFGYGDLKAKLKKIIQSHSERRSNYTMKGILLYGPPGCSKTMFVKALVTESRFTFFPLKCSDILSKFVGETEKALCTLFDQACLASPSIIFMDEVDALCSERTGMGTTSSGVVSELLSLVYDANKMREVLIIGATNRPHCIDESLFSGKFFDSIVHVGLPDCMDRCEIWKGILENVPKDEDISIHELCQATEGYSGAEIQGIYQHAAQSLLFSLPLDDYQMKDIDEFRIRKDAIFKAIGRLRPRTSKVMLRANEIFANKRRQECILCI